MLIEKNNHFDIWSKDLSIPILAIDIVIFTIYNQELCVLLSKNTENNTFGYSLPGGIVSKGFDLEENFDDILKNKTGLTGVYKEQLYTFGDAKRDPRGHVVSVTYYALVNMDNFLHKVDFTKVDIVKFGDLDNFNILYDHKFILNYAKQRLEWKLEYTNVAKNILPTKFRISQLQNIYEIITGKIIDKRNFQKKIFSLDILSLTGDLDKSTNRPAELYTFSDINTKIVDNSSII